MIWMLPFQSLLFLDTMGNMTEFTIIIYVFRGRAYLPTMGRLESGIWIHLQPVIEIELNHQELASAMKKIIDGGHKVLTFEEKEEWKKRRQPLLIATKCKSWRSLARNSAHYSVSKHKNNTIVDMSLPGVKSKGQFDSNKAKYYHQEVSLKEIAQVILDDVHTRPNVLE